MRRKGYVYYHIRAPFVREELSRMNLSQANCARALGVSPQYFSQLMNFHRKTGPRTRTKLMGFFQGFEHAQLFVRMKSENSAKS